MHWPKAYLLKPWQKPRLKGAMPVNNHSRAVIGQHNWRSQLRTAFDKGLFGVAAGTIANLLLSLTVLERLQAPIGYDWATVISLLVALAAAAIAFIDIRR